jgi:putative transposase
MDQKILTKRETQLRHSIQDCKVFEVKIVKSKLSKTSLNNMNTLFKEAKYFYNFCLSHDNLDLIDTKVKSVPVKVLDKFEDRKLSILPGQSKQSIKSKMFSNIKALSSLKKKGKKVGKLKFKSFLHSIPLVQHGMTYKIDFNTSRVKIQNIKQKLKVSGLSQIPKNIELANASLIKRCSDFYLHITTFSNKIEKFITETSVGIDFGCSTQLTLSNGIKIEYQVPISKRLKRLDRKITKKNRKKSNNKFKDQIKREKEYNKLNNKKKDIRNKIVHVLTNNFKYICFQDENLKEWQSGNHGKKIQNANLGGIIRDLKNKSHTPIEVNKFFPSTQLCPKCGCKNKLELKDRIYKCKCGYKKDRDIHAAKNIELEGMKDKKIPVSNKITNKYKIPVERRELKTEERNTSTTHIFDLLKKINGVRASNLVESVSQ